MSDTTLAFMVVGGVILIFLAGMVYGSVCERLEWLGRAMTKDRPTQSAHHCDGKFYYVIEEHVFVTEFIRVPLAEEEDTDASAITQQD